MNEFEAVINSLGEHIVSYIGRDHLRFVTVTGDELTQTAEISITLRDLSWAEEERAIDKMVELRALFLDDLSLDYRFVGDEDGSRVGATKALQLEFA